METDYDPPVTSERMNGEASRLVRSNTDEIIHQQFLAAQNNLDDVLVMAEELDELEPVDKKKDDEGWCLSALADIFLSIMQNP